ncbi:MAG: CCA tRNA nucleotidyltransferase [Proteobacteria bacterium]|nr:CCA tRNA nucleotidyltransferase [Pseudomonadota bacterium]
MPRRDLTLKAGQRAWLREPRLRALLRLLNGDGGETRVAGGAIRNAILGQPIADIDLATTLLPEQVSARAARQGFSVHPTGIDHGTVTVVVQGGPFEVTTLRRDVSTDGRRATVAFTADWRKDAFRRDFTMNAMFCDAAGKIYDFTDGYAACVNHRVSFVGSPAGRIREDYLRILRFFRFHAAYGRGALDQAGLAACKRLRKGLASLSVERIRQELLKLLVAPRAVETLKAMAEAKILAMVLPFQPEWRVLKRLPADAMLRLHVLAAPSDDLQQRLRLSKDEAKRLRALAEAPPLSPALRPDERRQLLYALGPAAFRDAVHLAWARSRASLADPQWRSLLRLPGRWAAPQFPVTGADLIATGLAPGPAMGEMLRSLEDWWIASSFKPSRGDLLARAKTQGKDHA